MRNIMTIGKKYSFSVFCPLKNISVHQARLPNSAPRKKKILRGSYEVQRESGENEKRICLVFLVV